MSRGKRFRRLLLAAVGLFLVAAAVAPFLKADRFAKPIRDALERSLHREVEIGRVRFHLITGPGFSVDDVVIHDDPAVGLEPLAYVTSLDIRLSWRSLITRRLELDRLQLVEPSLNLTKTPDGGWNFQPLLLQTLGVSRGGSLPGIEVRSGRLNFKFGTLKSAFYFTNADLDLWRSGDSPQTFGLRFSGEPARTDRAAQGFGRLTGSGSWSFPPGRESELDMDLELERSGISEVMTLIAGRDVGVHGSMTSGAHVSGQISDLAIRGQLRLQDLHRWDLLPTRGGEWPVAYRGRLDLWNQKLELETVQDVKVKLPVVARVRAAGYLAQPRWGVSATLDHLPAQSLLEIARQLGSAFPEGLTLDGAVSGVIGYSSSEGVQGQVRLTEGTFGTEESGAFRVVDAEVVVSGSRLNLGPARVFTPSGQVAIVTGQYDQAKDSLQLGIATKGLALAAVNRGFGTLFDLNSAPLLSVCTGGLWHGTLHFSKDEGSSGEWSGAFGVEKTELALPGLREPLKIASAAISMQPERIHVTRLRGSIGDVQLAADYTYPGGPGPHRVDLSISEVEAGQLEELLGPTLQRRQNFLARALRRPVLVPDWLRARKIEGVIRVGRLKLGDVTVSDMRGKLAWEGTSVSLSDVEARILDGRATGALRANLRQSQPVYSMTGEVVRLPWRGGQVSLGGKLETSGLGSDLWLNLTSAGIIEARAIEISTEDVKSLNGSYELAIVRGVPRVQVTGMEMILGQETFYGQGGSQPDGHLQFELASAKRQMRLGGRLIPLQFEIALPR